MSSEKVIVTGAAGFIGSQLGLHLHKAGYQVVLIDNLAYGYRENLLYNGKEFGSFVLQDIRDSNLADTFRGADTVFHLAAISALPVCQSNPSEAYSVNVVGTAGVLEAARRAGVRRVVVASTSAVYENNKDFPCGETDPVSPTLIYSASKVAAEMLCRSYGTDYGMEIAVTRYYNVYGPQQDIHRKQPPFVGYVIRELLEGRAPILHSDGRQRRDYVYVDDVIAMNVLCMTHPAAAAGVFNVASGHAVSVNELYDIIAGNIAGRIGYEEALNIVPVFRSSDMFWDKYGELFQGYYPMSREKLAAEVDKFSLGSTYHALNVLGWAAHTSHRDGIERTVSAVIKNLKDVNRF